MRRVALPILLLLTACQRELELPKEPDPAPPVEPFDVDPPIAQAAPGEPVTMELVGGTPPFAFEPTVIALGAAEAEAAIERLEFEGGASAWIDGRSLFYEAPKDRGDFDQELPLVDATGVEVTAKIHVGSPLRIVPTYAFVNASGRVAISATGGKPPYAFVVDDKLGAVAGDPLEVARSTWLQEKDAVCEPTGEPITTAEAGGTLMLASSQGTSVVTVTDALQAVQTAELVRGSPLRVLPSQVPELSPGGAQFFEVVGGDPAYHHWLSGPGLDGVVSLDDAPVLPAGMSWADGLLSLEDDFQLPGGAASATYVLEAEGWSVAAACPRVDAVHRRARAEITISVPPPPPRTELTVVSPVAVEVGQSVQLVAQGGVAPIEFSFARRQNFSGGAVTSGGAYVAGPTPAAVDHVEVVDGEGTLRTIEVRVVDSGLPASRWLPDWDLAQGRDEHALPAYERLLVAGGLAFQRDDDGLLSVRDAPEGQVLALADVNGDGLTDLFVQSRGPALGIQLYVGTPGGDFVWSGGGVVATAIGAVAPRAGAGGPPRFLVTDVSLQGGGPTCAAAWLTLRELITGSAPTSCAIGPGTMWGRSPSILALGPGRVAIVGADVILADVADDGSLTTVRRCDALSEQHDSLDAVPVDLDADGNLDVARLVRNTDGAEWVRTCMYAGTDVQYEALRRGQTLFAGGEDALGGGRVLLASAVEEGFDRPSLLRYAVSEASPPAFEATPLELEVSIVGAGDLDGDGRSDLVVAGQDASLRLLLGDPDGGFGRTPRVRVGPRGRYDYALTDLDGDGADDVVASSNGFQSVWAGTRSDGRPALAFVGDTAGEGLQALGEGIDWDGHGARELLGFRGDFSAVSVAYDPLSGGLRPAEALDLLVNIQTVGRPRVFSPGQGAAELLFMPLLGANEEATGFVLLGRDEAGDLVERQHVAFPDGRLLQGDRLLVEDVTGDGRPDLVASGAVTVEGGLAAPREGLWIGRGAGEGGTFAFPSELAAFDSWQVAAPDAGGTTRRLLADPVRHLVYKFWEADDGRNPRFVKLQVFLADTPGVAPAAPIDLLLDQGVTTSLQGAAPAIVDLGRVTDAPEPRALLELLLPAVRGGSGQANALVVFPLGDDGRPREPLNQHARTLRLAAEGVSARWMLLRSEAGALPDLVVSVQPSATSVAPELLMLRNSFTPWEFQPGTSAPPPFAP